MKTDDLTFLDKNLSRINQAILKSLPPKNFSRITEAIHYSIMNGGKRIRPQIILLMSDAIQVDVSDATIDLIAAAGELIHCYSLIHDDLPAMDDDDFRRGQLSCHKKFDEATAILAGDAIQPLSLEILTTIEDQNLSSEIKLKIINLFSKACGPKGMVEGQSRDILSENKLLSEDELDEMHYLKTGKLIEACVMCVCLLKKDIYDGEIKKFIEFSQKFGLAFQIRDDVLDIIGDEKEIGKPINSDINKNKSTYPSILGVEESQKKAESLGKQAMNILKELPYETKDLESLCSLIVSRNN
jgi:farnesyl diphosphate synthase|tara:strand:+ start:1457 stop:2353 length:897 start_codon:yes stop_codon:yes gene_type:complete